MSINTFVRTRKGYISLLVIVILVSCFLGCNQSSYTAVKQKKTVDNRKTVSELSDENLYSIATLKNEKKAWFVGYWGTVLFTPDDGMNWKPRSVGDKATPTLLGVSFADENVGWIVGKEGLILNTKNGGESWIKQKGKTKRDLLAVFAVDQKTVWAAGDRGTLLFTNDGGENWKYKRLGDVILNDIEFLDNNVGWIVGEFGTILRTTDGGNTWNEKESIIGAPSDIYLLAVSFSDPMRGMATGLGGIVLYTEDGGRTWKGIKTNTTSSLYSIYYSHDTAIAVGDSGAIERIQLKENGVEFLKVQKPNIFNWYRGVTFSSKDVGWIVGENGCILRTEDGGATWKRIL